MENKSTIIEQNLEKELSTFVEGLIFDINQGFDHNSIYKDIQSLLQSQRTKLIDEIVGLIERQKYDHEEWCGIKSDDYCDCDVDRLNDVLREMKNKIINLKEK